MPTDIATLAEEVAACRACAAEFAATRTAHAPRPVVWFSRAPILIASQAPGMRAHRSGLPFDDPSGDRLRDWMGVGRETFFDRARVSIAPMAFCFPGYDAAGGDLPPPRRCAEMWRARVMAAIGRPALTLLIGGHAQRWTLGAAARAGVTKLVAEWRAHLADGVLPLPHPSWRNNAWLRRNPWFEAEVLPELRARVAALT